MALDLLTLFIGKLRQEASEAPLSKRQKIKAQPAVEGGSNKRLDIVEQDRVGPVLGTDQPPPIPHGDGSFGKKKKVKKAKKGLHPSELAQGGAEVGAALQRGLLGSSDLQTWGSLAPAWE